MSQSSSTYNAFFEAVVRQGYFSAEFIRTHLSIFHPDSQTTEYHGDFKADSDSEEEGQEMMKLTIVDFDAHSDEEEEDEGKKYQLEESEDEEKEDSQS